MAMGKRRHAKQPTMWVASQDLPRTAAHPFYRRLNQILALHDFDGYVEGLSYLSYEPVVKVFTALDGQRKTGYWWTCGRDEHDDRN